jgi:MFS family permease
VTAFAALRSRNYRLLWIGQLISFTGSAMQNAAIFWHVSLLAAPEQKGLALGLVGLVRVAPVLVLALAGGVVADAVNRRKLLMLTQSALLLVATTLALITFRGLTAVWPLYLLTALSAAATALDAPARQSLYPNLVPREHLPNAISLNSIMVEIASVIGPALGGQMIASLPLGWVYAANAASYVAVVGALLLMRHVSDGQRSGRTVVSLRAAVEGLRFVFSAPLIRSTMLIDFIANFFASAIALLPVFAQDVLHVGSEGYGLLYAAPSLGALIASLVMVRAAERVDRRGLALVWAVMVYSAATIVFGLSRSFWLTFVSLAVFGGADMVSTVFRNIIRQLATPDHLRGRMTSVNMIFFMGGPHLGEVEAGIVAQLFGAPISVISGGIGALVGTLGVAWTTPRLRAYRREDPLPGLQPAPAD